MYEILPASEPIFQGDLIDECPLFALDPQGGNVDLNAHPVQWRSRICVLTQSCDLAQSKTTKVVVAVVYAAELLVEQGVLKAAMVRDQIRRGLTFGWYFLPTGKDPVRFPESLLDLRDIHTVHRRVLERLVADGKRSGRIQTPYREHLAQHFAVTYMRIALPEPYGTQS